MSLCMGCMAEKGDIEICPNCGLNETDLAGVNPAFLRPGTELNGRYIVGIALGQGGFGITYIGYDKVLSTKVAIKEYYPSDIAGRNSTNGIVTAYTQSVDDYMRGKERFLEEARTLAKFSDHPCIVGVKDCFDANGTAYMVMEFLEGVSLKEYLKRKGGKLGVSESISMLTPVMDALRAVHKIGIIHRDISPDNIFITTDARVRLIDFGAARQSIGGQKSLSIMLKPGYAPEEQYRTRGNQGPWTDVYALTATLYRMITGSVPPDSLERVMEDMLEIPLELPTNVQAALSHGLAVRAPERYSSIEQLQKVLLGDESVKEPSTVNIPNSLPDEVFEPTRSERSSGNSGTNKVLVAAVAALSVVVIAAVICITTIALNTQDKQIANTDEVQTAVNSTTETSENHSTNTEVSTPEPSSSSDATTAAVQQSIYMPDLYSPKYTYKRMTGIENSYLITSEYEYNNVRDAIENSYRSYSEFVSMGSRSQEDFKTYMFPYMYTESEGYKSQWEYFNKYEITSYSINSSNVKSVRRRDDTYYAWVTENITETKKGQRVSSSSDWVYRLKITNRGILIFDYIDDPVN